MLRRDFFKLGYRALTAIGAASVVGRLSQVNALAQSSCPTDYKALVCVFLFGGNDGNNTLVPVSTQNPVNTYANYASIRGGLALPQASLNAIGTSKGEQFGLHPGLAELATLYNSNKNVALLANVGTLVNPLTQSQYLQKTAGIPVNLFSHLDQQTEWQSSQAQGFANTGWGGRLADAMAGCNGSFPMILSLDGSVLFANGSQTSPATLTAGQTLGLQGFNTSAASVARLAALKNLLSFDNGVALSKASNAIGSSGINQASQLSSALAGGTAALTTVFPATSLGQQLQQVAKIINVRSALGVSRQIFFTYLGGFDTHDKELTDQGSGLQQVSQAMNAFYKATGEMGISKDVVTFTESDFGRTLQPSGGSTLGTDHAWGSHHMIMGDSVKGGDIYGTFPTQHLSGPDDANNRGVWIPTTSLDQYGAALATWFGVSDPAKLAQVFPNLANFTTPPPAFL